MPKYKDEDFITKGVNFNLGDAKQKGWFVHAMSMDGNFSRYVKSLIDRDMENKEANIRHKIETTPSLDLDDLNVGGVI